MDVSEDVVSGIKHELIGKDPFLAATKLAEAVMYGANYDLFKAVFYMALLAIKLGQLDQTESDNLEHGEAHEC